MRNTEDAGLTWENKLTKTKGKTQALNSQKLIKKCKK